jgi:hypothetical protein
MDPVLDGWAASRAGAVLATARSVFNPGADTGAAVGGLSTLGIGIVAAVLLLAYWYRRVL